MSLRVDLMLPDEHRVVTPMHPKTMLRIVLATLILVALLGGLSAWQDYRVRENERQSAHERWAKMEVLQKEAAQMGKDLAMRRGIYGELQGWRGTRLPVVEWLERLAALCPPTVQLTDLRLTEAAILSGPKNLPCRRFELHLTGRTGGPQADRNVRSLQAIFTNQPPFSNAVESVAIPDGAFRQDPAAVADKSARVFELVIRCAPRVFP